jgi:hypothetical protein
LFKIIYTLGWSEIEIRKNLLSLQSQTMHCIYLFGTTFVLYDFSKFWVRLDAPRPQILKKMAENFKHLQFFLDIFKIFGPNRTFYSLFDASCKYLQGKNYSDWPLVDSFNRKRGQKCPLLTIFFLMRKFHLSRKYTLNILEFEINLRQHKIGVVLSILTEILCDFPNKFCIVNTNIPQHRSISDQFQTYKSF